MTNTDTIAVDHQVLLISDADGAIEATVRTVVTQHVAQRLNVCQLVDRDHFDVLPVTVFIKRTQHTAADTSKTVDGDTGCHGFVRLITVS